MRWVLQCVDWCAVSDLSAQGQAVQEECAYQVKLVGKW